MFISIKSLRSLGNKIFYFFLLVLIFGVSGYAFMFDVGGLSQSSNPIKANLALSFTITMYLHLWFGGLALAILPIQIFFAKRYLKVHRATGLVYAGAIIVSGLVGLILSQNAFGGISSTLALSTLSILWITTTLLAAYYGYKGRINLHKKWLFRSVALTLSAVTLRMLAPLHYYWFGLELGQQVLYWSCWLINICIAEWFIYSKLNKLCSDNDAAEQELAY